MSVTSELREIAKRAGISFATVYNRYHLQGLRGEALAAPTGSLRKGRKQTFVVRQEAEFRSWWPVASRPGEDQAINAALHAWKRVDPFAYSL